MDTPKCSDTISRINSGVTSLLLEETMSFNASAARVISIGPLLFNLKRAISLLSEPSSSRIFVFTFVAMYSRTSRGILYFSR